MAPNQTFEVVGFDADDTLWKSEDSFRDAEALFVELVAPFAPDGIDVTDALHAIEQDNIAVSGYGVKAFALSMVQAAVTTTSGRVSAAVIGELVDHAHEMLMDPVELLDGVPETLADVGRAHRLVLITKGDLVHQTRKITTSGLEHHFEHIAVVLEKDAATYRRVLGEWSVDPRSFLFVGNSVRSDVLPVLEVGGSGIHVPYHLTWQHEVVPNHVSRNHVSRNHVSRNHVSRNHVSRNHSGEFDELGSIRDLPGWLAN